MTDIGIGVRISEDRKIAEIEFVGNGQGAKPVQLDADQLSSLISILGEARARLLDGCPMIPLKGQEVRTVYHPNWYIQVAQIDGSLLAFDHPAFGAVGFAIPKSEVAEIVRILKEHLAMPLPRLEHRN